MSLRLYDNAMEVKLKEVFPNVVGASPDEAFSASEVDGKVNLPLISFYRLSNPVSPMSMPEAFRGRMINYRSESEAIMATTLPMLMTYQVDIWAVKRHQVDDIFRELVMYLVRKPNLTVKVGNYEETLDFSMQLTDTENSSEVTNFGNEGRVYRCTLTYTVEGKLFFESDQPLLERVEIKSYIV